MNLHVNETTIRRMNKVYLPSTENPTVDEQLIASFIGNAFSLGYALNKNVYGKLLSDTDSTALIPLLETLKATRGAQYRYEPMYPNFPKQVIEASDLELWVNATMHYIGDVVGIRIMPDYVKEARPELRQFDEVEVLGLATDKDLEQLFIKIAQSAQPFNETDRQDIENLAHYATSNLDVPVKENLSWLSSVFTHLDWSDHYKTVTDVLRYAVALSGGDVTLAENTRFKLPRPHRHKILKALNKVVNTAGNVHDDFLAYQGQWKRLAHALRYNDYKTKYQYARTWLNRVQNDNLGRSYNYHVELAIQRRDAGRIIDLLQERPGVFARRLHEVILKVPMNRHEIVAGFAEVAPKVSLNVLVQMHNYFSGATKEEHETQMVHVKSKHGQNVTVFTDNKREGDYTDVLNVIEQGIAARSDKHRKVFFTEDPSHYAIPLGVRSMSTGSKQIARGSRIPLKDSDSDKNFLRLFMHWQDGKHSGRVDLDLSVLFVSEGFENNSTVAYYNMRNGVAVHSGDITSAPRGASEFIDVDIQEALRAGYRWAIPSVYNYSRQMLSEVKDALTGFMMRESMSSGEVYEPKTVRHAYKLTQDTYSSVPFVLDLKTRELVWFDTALMPARSYNYNVHNNKDKFITALKHLVLGSAMTVEKLASLVGEIVEDEEEATLVLNPAQFEDVAELMNL